MRGAAAAGRPRRDRRSPELAAVGRDRARSADDGDDLRRGGDVSVMTGSIAPRVTRGPGRPGDRVPGARGGVVPQRSTGAVPAAPGAVRRATGYAWAGRDEDMVGGASRRRAERGQRRVGRAHVAHRVEDLDDLEVDPARPEDLLELLPAVPDEVQLRGRLDARHGHVRVAAGEAPREVDEDVGGVRAALGLVHRHGKGGSQRECLHPVLLVVHAEVEVATRDGGHVMVTRIPSW